MSFAWWLQRLLKLLWLTASPRANSVGALLAIVAMFAWGIGDFAGGLAAKKDEYFAITITREAFETVVVVIVAILVPGAPHLRDVIIGIAAGVIGAICLPLFYHALSKGTMSVIAPVSGVVGAAVPVIAGLLSGEHLNVFEYLGVALAIPGILLVSLEAQHHEEKNVTRLKLVEDFGIACLTGFGFGVYFVLFHHVSSDSGLWPNVFGSISIVAALGAFGLITKKRFVSKRSVRNINILGGTADVIGYEVSTLATRRGLLSVTGVITALFPVVTALVAVVWLKESLPLKNKAGLVLSVVALGFLGS
jgi:drug/metabolite transporter (DMT)-like permease